MRVVLFPFVNSIRIEFERKSREEQGKTLFSSIIFIIDTEKRMKIDSSIEFFLRLTLLERLSIIFGSIVVFWSILILIYLSKKISRRSRRRNVSRRIFNWFENNGFIDDDGKSSSNFSKLPLLMITDCDRLETKIIDLEDFDFNSIGSTFLKQTFN